MENNIEQNKPMVEDTNILLIGYLLCLAMIFTGFVTVFWPVFWRLSRKKRPNQPGWRPIGKISGIALFGLSFGL
jgi:hypothetical protein